MKIDYVLSHYPRPDEASPQVDFAELQERYEASALALEEDTFALVRVVGNDLPPRHQIGQGRMNLEFMLEHEPEFERCTKVWILNRIIDQQERGKLRELLEKHGRRYHEILYDEEDYARIEWDLESFPHPMFFESKAFKSLNEDRVSMAYDQLYRHKNSYVMNNNGARNVALRLGRSLAKWVLPWDGNCFVTEKAWLELTGAVVARPHLKYFIVPMARITDNRNLLDPGFEPNAVEEPQIVFRRDADEEFDEAYRYGRRPKVELLWRLGVPGPWDRWRNNSWDVPFPRLSQDAGSYATAGWVARLNSGFSALEQDDKASFKNRGQARQSAVREFLDNLDARILRSRTSPEVPLSICMRRLEAQKASWARGDKALGALIESLRKDAEQALQRERLSVVDKATLPPSEDPHDYWHPAPYWWPNPNTQDGLPYVRRDGHRVPGTQMYEADSSNYDRTRAQHLFDDVSILGLAGFFLDEPRYSEHGARLLRTWFVDAETRMTPHLQYSQVRLGHNKNNGMSTGLIEFKDLYYMLDGIRLLTRAGSVDAELGAALREWFGAYLQWLKESKQGQKERAANNNHGVLYDVQILAVAHFIGDLHEVNQALRRARDRIGEHFTLEGRQPHEMTRTLTQHYCTFNLQSWANLAAASDAVGFDLWNYRHSSGACLEQAFRWLLAHHRLEWPYPQIEPFDEERMMPLYFASRRVYPFSEIESFSALSLDPTRVKPRFWPHDGIRPYWNLG